MIIGTIFFAFVAACALVLLVVIVKSGVEETRAVAHQSRPAAPSHHVILPGEREERFTRQPDRRRAERRRATVA